MKSIGSDSPPPPTECPSRVCDAVENIPKSYLPMYVHDLYTKQLNLFSLETALYSHLATHMGKGGDTILAPHHRKTN